MEQKLHSGHGTLQSHHQLYLSDPVRILQPWGISRRYEATAGFLQSVPTTDGRHCCGNSVVLIAGLAALLLGLWVGTKADCLPGSYIISMNFDVWSRDLLSGQVHCSVVAFHCCFCGWTKALAISNTPGKSAAWRLWFKSHFAGGTKRNQWKHFNWNRNQKSYCSKMFKRSRAAGMLTDPTSHRQEQHYQCRPSSGSALGSFPPFHLHCWQKQRLMPLRCWCFKSDTLIWSSAQLCFARESPISGTHLIEVLPAAHPPRFDCRQEQGW